MHYDVVVVGAGPTGAAAATQLARKNCRVLLLEKMKHPRHKSCGGGISSRLCAFLDKDFSDLIENKVTELTIEYKGKKVSFSSKEPFAFLVRRPQFDAYLTEKAKQAGVNVRENAPLQKWDETEDGIAIESPEGKYTASYLIAADGSNSSIARKLYPKWKRFQAPALEEAIKYGAKGRDSKTKPNEILFALSVKQGYGWIFPKRDEAAVGIGIFNGKRISPRQEYTDFLNQKVEWSESSARPQGAILPLYQKTNEPLVKGRILLAGDAAALVDPFFGEGIYYGVRSGQMAANAVAQACHDQERLSIYSETVSEAFYPEFEVAQKIARLVYTFPGFFLQMVRRYPSLMENYAGVFQGDMGYVDFWKFCQKRALQKLNPFTQFSGASTQS